MTFQELLVQWVDRRLRQPARLQYPDSGAWRTATDEEYAR
jgi:hypothetical protein